MIEGWAVYEKNDAGKRLQNSDEMWLMYYKWNLRTTCNAILDFSVHANNMSRTSAAFIGWKLSTASGSWKMESSYILGPALFILYGLQKFMILERLKKKEDGKFLKQFHEKF
jgi:hypothetical protein